MVGGPHYRGVLVCRWHTDHHPDHTEAALLGGMVDYATALMQRADRSHRAGAPDEAGIAMGSLRTGLSDRS